MSDLLEQVLEVHYEPDNRAKVSQVQAKLFLGARSGVGRR